MGHEEERIHFPWRAWCGIALLATICPRYFGKSGITHMARSKNISTPPIKKKPPPEQKATPISVAQILHQPLFPYGRARSSSGANIDHVACARVARPRKGWDGGLGIGVLWASDNHMEGIVCRLN